MASSMSRFQFLIRVVRSAASRVLAPRPAPAHGPVPPVAVQPIELPAALRSRATRAMSQRPPVQRVARSPVRVLRVAEAGSRRVAGARMVISGRLADVCAELERLAALEAAAT